MRLLEATAVRYDARVCLSVQCFYVSFISQLQTTQVSEGQYDEESAVDHNPC